MWLLRNLNSCADGVQAFLDPSRFSGELRVDPLSRCAALSLPCDSLAILPFYQSQVDLDLVDADNLINRSVIATSYLATL